MIGQYLFAFLDEEVPTGVFTLLFFTIFWGIYYLILGGPYIWESRCSCKWSHLLSYTLVIQCYTFAFCLHFTSFFILGCPWRIFVQYASMDLVLNACSCVAISIPQCCLLVRLFLSTGRISQSQLPQPSVDQCCNPWGLALP